jgi:hypothetical protein
MVWHPRLQFWSRGRRCEAERPLRCARARHRVLAMLGRSSAVLTTAVLTAHVGLSNASAGPRGSVTPPSVSVPTPIVQPTRTPREIAATQHPTPIQVEVARAKRVGIRSSVNGQQQRIRPGAAEREVAGRVAVAGGVLVLPAVAHFGVPVILDVPELGYVELPEDRYAELYDKLSSADPEQVQEAIAALREIKAAEDAQVEAMQHGAVNVIPTDSDATTPTDADVPAAAERDLSEPISFGASYPKFHTRRHSVGPRGLY